VPRLASILPLISTRAVARPFTYRVPGEVERGHVVDIRFGGARRRGVVVAVDVEAPEGVEAVPVERVRERLPPALIDLALWIAAYYGTTPGRALGLVAPAQRTARGERPTPGERERMGGEAAPAQVSRAQQVALERIEAALEDGSGGAFLLWGATGSGKTEVYL